MASEEQCLTDNPSPESPKDAPLAPPMRSSSPEFGEGLSGGLMLVELGEVIEETSVNKLETNSPPPLEQELEQGHNLDRIPTLNYNSPQISLKDEENNFTSILDEEVLLADDRGENNSSASSSNKDNLSANTETEENLFSILDDEDSLSINFQSGDDNSSNNEDGNNLLASIEDGESFSTDVENTTSMSIEEESNNLVNDDLLHNELKKLSVINSSNSTESDVVQRKQSNENCCCEDQWCNSGTLENKTIVMGFNEHLIRKEDIDLFSLDTGIVEDSKTYDRDSTFAQQVSEYISDVIGHVLTKDESSVETSATNEIDADNNTLQKKSFSHFIKGIDSSQTDDLTQTNITKSHPEDTLNLVSDIQKCEKNISELQESCILEKRSDDLTFALEKTLGTSYVKALEVNQNYSFCSQSENASRYVNIESEILSEKVKTLLNFDKERECNNDLTRLNESDQSLMCLPCNTKQEQPLEDPNIRTKFTSDHSEKSLFANNSDSLHEAELRKSSLNSQTTLPTISERPTTDDEMTDNDIDIGMDFDLHNSPMLRRSRKTSEEQARRDCRFIFSDEENNNSDQEGSPKQHFTSLRDSLDIAKHTGELYDLSDVETKDVENSDEEILEESSVDKQSTTPPSEKLLPYIGRSLPNKKKTSIKSDRDDNRRRVSFPEDDASLITSYLEPVNPWYHMNNVSTDIISEAYKKSCNRHKTRALPIILQQITALPVSVGVRIECLSIRNHKLEAGQCECLEEIFRRVQFQTLDFEGCELDDDTAIPLFDMIEFYDSAIQLNISVNNKIGNRGWQACARMLKRTPSLRMLEARNTSLSEQNMPIICKALRLGTRLHTLHLENCNLTGRPLVNLAGALRLNDTITDLYLSDNRLGSNDCIQLGNLVRANKTLKILDLRNNNIQDTGCAHICKEIVEQQRQQLQPFIRGTIGGEECVTSVRNGLTTLVLWNNHITVHAVPYFSLMLHSNLSLETLNLGRNNLTSEGILLLKNALIRNRSLRRLGLQATRVGNEGAVALAECIADNTAISRLDLRENSIQVAGLLALCRSLKLNSTIVQLDLDANPRAEPSPELYEQHLTLHIEIKQLCQKNQTNAHLRESTGCRYTSETSVSVSSPESRKISLTCETTVRTDTSVGESKRYRSPAPSPSVSPCPSPSLSPSPSPVPSPLKNRFKVFKVSEECSTPPHSSAAPVGIISTSAPAFLMQSAMSGSLPSLVPTVERPNRFSTGGRFTVTKVPESSSTPFKSSLPNNRAMSSPSLNVPSSDATAAPTIVVSSPNKAVRGFSIEITETEESTALLERSAIKERRSGSLDLPVTTSASSTVSSPSSDSTSPQDDVFFEETNPRPSVSKIQRAPLASAEAGSFDSDTDEDDSEVTTQSSDSTHSDEVRIATEQNLPTPAWEDKGTSPPPTCSVKLCNKK